MLSVASALRGTIGLLHPGDTIAIDIPNQPLTVKLSDDELAERLKTRKPVERKLTGYLSKYASMATSAATGAVLEWE